MTLRRALFRREAAPIPDNPSASLQPQAHVAPLSSRLGLSLFGAVYAASFRSLIISMIACAHAPYVRRFDLTGLFWTKRCERMGLAKELGDAEEAV